MDAGKFFKDFYNPISRFLMSFVLHLANPTKFLKKLLPKKHSLIELFWLYY